ncbi:hypothetical protein BGX38DRAFT_1150816 [Terfezia claveryi]|nr:hypothetical protein BGX38DRAFT_1150816 [Terfezia claveryi]
MIPFISKTAADTTVAESKLQPRYITETVPQVQPATDGYQPRHDKIGTVGGVFGVGKAISAFEMTRHLLSKGRRVQDIKVAWDKLGFWEKDFQIEDLMEWLVDMRRYNLAARILEAIHGSFRPEAVGNCYAEIIHGNIATLSIPKGDAYWISFRERQANRLLRLLKVFIKPLEGDGIAQKLLFNSLKKTQFVTYHLCRNLAPEDLPAFYKYLVDCGIFFHTFTILHFIDRLCKEGDYYKGFILMKCMVEEGRALGFLLVRKAFTLLLSKATKAGNEEVSADILKSMYACGLAADTPIYNVLMYNAISSGKVETVLTIYSKMLEEGLEPNQVTYALLFHLHKRSRNIPEQHKVVQLTIQSHGRLSTWMGADVVHAAVLNAPRGRRFKSALEVFHKLYKPGVLAHMGLVPKTDESLDRTNRMDPDTVVVTIVIMAFLRDESDTNRIWQLYLRYKELRDSKEHGAFFGCQPVIANGFMYAFGKELRTMDKALEVMQDLTIPSQVQWRLRTRPNRYSWSILAKAFTLLRRLEEAQWIIKAMQIDGFWPTEVTWEKLLEAYIEEEKPEEAGETLGHMLASGVKIKGKTLDLLLTVEKNEEFARGVERVGQFGLDVKEEEAVTLPVDITLPVTSEGGERKGWKEYEEDRRKERVKFAQELNKRETEEGFTAPPLPDLSVDDI